MNKQFSGNIKTVLSGVRFFDLIICIIWLKQLIQKKKKKLNSDNKNRTLRGYGFCVRNVDIRTNMNYNIVIKFQEVCNMAKLPDIQIDKVVKAGKKALDELEKSGQEKKVVEVVAKKTGISEKTINSALKTVKDIK